MKKIDWVWLLISVGLYCVSTIGLANGTGAGLAFGIEGVTKSAYTISVDTAIVLGWIIAITIQLYETKVLIGWTREDNFEKAVATIMFVLDFLAICLALGLHLNVIWMIQNHSDIPGMVIHTFGLFMQIFAAFLGCVVAEMSFAKGIGSTDNLPQIGLSFVKIFRNRQKSNTPIHRYEPNDTGGWENLPEGIDIRGKYREIREQGLVLVRGNDNVKYTVSKNDPRYLNYLQTCLRK